MMMKIRIAVVALATVMSPALDLALMFSDGCKNMQR